MDPAAVMPPQPEGPDSHFRRRRDEVVSALLAQMSLEEKVGQLIVSAVGDVAGPAVRDRSGALSEFLDTVRPGGLLFFTENIHTPEQVRGFIRDLQADRRIPLFVAVDEEGGVVSRLTRDPQMPATSIPSARRVGQSGDTELAYQLARVIGRELRALGFNMNFAPVADVLTNPENQVIGSRAYGSDVDTVSRFVSATVRGLEDTGMCAVLKHYPGHGDTAGDTHNTPVVIGHDLERLERIELVPFRAGIDAGAPAVMTGHIALPEVTGSEAAATFSGRLVDELLRGSIGFKGLVISDALTMGAVTARYSPEEAALQAIEAGVDVLLRPVSPGEVHTALIEAVHNGRLSMERIDRSVSRILQTKIDYSILVPDDAVFHARASERPAPEPEVVGSSQHQSIVQRALNEIRAGGAQ
jgi:beta-N-acetylhexosaminidase